MVPLAVVKDKIVELHEGLDLERGWLIHKNNWTVFLWWVVLGLILFAAMATHNVVPH